MTTPEMIEHNVQKYNAAVEEIRREVEKRFWKLELDSQLQWHFVTDQLGRHLCRPMPLPQLRGWIQGLPAQA